MGIMIGKAEQKKLAEKGAARLEARQKAEGGRLENIQAQREQLVDRISVSKSSSTTIPVTSSQTKVDFLVSPGFETILKQLDVTGKPVVTVSGDKEPARENVPLARVDRGIRYVKNISGPAEPGESPSSIRLQQFRERVAEEKARVKEEPTGRGIFGSEIGARAQTEISESIKRQGVFNITAQRSVEGSLAAGFGAAPALAATNFFGGDYFKGVVSRQEQVYQEKRSAREKSFEDRPTTASFNIGDTKIIEAKPFRISDFTTGAELAGREILLGTAGFLTGTATEFRERPLDVGITYGAFELGGAAFATTRFGLTAVAEKTGVKKAAEFIPPKVKTLGSLTVKTGLASAVAIPVAIEVSRGSGVSGKGAAAGSSAVYLAAAGKGVEAGTKKATELISVVRTRGLQRLSPELVIAPEFPAQTFPQITRGQKAGELLKEFQETKGLLPGSFAGEKSSVVYNVQGKRVRFAQSDLGLEEIRPGSFELTNVKAGGFTASPGSFKSQFEILASDRPFEPSGLYQSPRLNPTFLQVLTKAKSFLSLSLPKAGEPTVLFTQPEKFVLNPSVAPGQTSLASPLQARGALARADKGLSMVTFSKSEKEAVIGEGTLGRVVRKRYFVEYEGVRIPVYEAETPYGLQLPKTGKALASTAPLEVGDVGTLSKLYGRSSSQRARTGGLFGSSRSSVSLKSVYSGAFGRSYGVSSARSSASSSYGLSSGSSFKGSSSSLLSSGSSSSARSSSGSSKGSSSGSSTGSFISRGSGSGYGSSSGFGGSGTTTTLVPVRRISKGFEPSTPRKSGGATLKLKGQYVPSIEASVFNIKGKQPSRFAVISGLSVRPLKI